MLKLKDMSKQTQELINKLAKSLEGMVQLEEYTDGQIELIYNELINKGIQASLYFDGETLLYGILEEFEETQNINFDFD